MDQEAEWAPTGVDTSVPSPARAYDYLLGGKDNYKVDRDVAELMLSIAPDTRLAARANRAFLVRAVRALAQAGVKQFIDLGSGVPTSPNVHEVAREVHPDARVVYVDRDPIAAAHGRALLATDADVTVVQADITRPGEVLDDPALNRLIDFDQPVAVLFVAVLHVIKDTDDPAGIVAAFRATLSPGSHVVVSQFSTDSDPEAMAHASQSGPIQISFRSGEQILGWLDGLTPLDPGLVEVQDWRPDRGDEILPAKMKIAAVVARQP